MTKEAMFRAEMLNAKLGEYEQELQQLDAQHGQVRELIDALDHFVVLTQGEKMLVSLGPGIFARATFSGNTDLLVNVGDGIFVPKTPESVQEQLRGHLEEMETYQRDLHKKFNELLGELDKLKETFA